MKKRKPCGCGDKRAPIPEKLPPQHREMPKPNVRQAPQTR